MRRTLFWLTLACALTLLPGLLTSAARAQDTKFSAPPVVSVPKVRIAPKIDGIVEPGEWANAAPLSPFVLVGGQGRPVNATSVWVMYDEHNLYIGAILSDPNPAALKAAVTDRDGPVWEDDDLELFFDTDDQHKSYIHLAVNPKETQYDAYMKDKSGDYRWTARCATLADGWSVEMALPFANDFPPAPGIVWGFSAARHSVSANELSSWDRKTASFHELGSFGSLIFSDKPLSLEITSLGSLWLGKNTAQVAVRNNSDQTAACKINVRVLGRDKHGSFFGVTKVAAPPTSRQSANVPYSVYEDGFSTVAFSLSDAAGKTVWRSSPYPVWTPEISPQIAAIERSLGSATRGWLALPDGDSKKSLQGDLDSLTVQWRYLETQYRDRAKLEKSELQGLQEFADKLQKEAQMLDKQIQTAKTSGQANVRFGVSTLSSLQHVFPDEFGFETGQPLTVDACCNEVVAGQLVVLPFC